MGSNCIAPIKVILTVYNKPFKWSVFVRGSNRTYMYVHVPHPGGG